MCRPAWSPSHEKAMRVPSGENVGPVSRPGNVVKGIARSGGTSADGEVVTGGDTSPGRLERSQMPPPTTSTRAATAATAQTASREVLTSGDIFPEPGPLGRLR